MPEGAEVPEAGTELTSAGQIVGSVTSAGMGHSVGRALAMGYVSTDLAVNCQSIDVGDVKSAIVHAGPIYDPKNLRSRD